MPDTPISPEPDSPEPSPAAPDASPSFRLSRRNFVRTVVYSTLAGMVGVPAWMRYLEPHWLDLAHYQVALPGLATPPSAAAGEAADDRAGATADGSPTPPIRLLHLSDFHAGKYVSLGQIGAAIDRGLKQSPDLICITGDFVTDLNLPDMDAYRDLLARLPAAAPTYASLGNHDGGSWSPCFPTPERIETLLADAGITLLRNRAEILTVRGQQLRLVGLGDLWSRDLNAALAFATPPEATDDSLPTVLLSHNPDSKEEVGDYPWQLMLCGHTHGGQLRIPFTGGTPFAPVRDLRYVAGLNPWRDRLICTSRAVGNLHGMRLNCRPEIGVLDLQPAAPRQA